ncbi:MAG: hypothetical protein U9Q68_09560 [Euryarchaeota archaeon]|nr:hypothetical protein [Euryarchaeota archaeon]
MNGRGGLDGRVVVGVLLGGTVYLPENGLLNGVMIWHLSTSVKLTVPVRTDYEKKRMT